MFRIFILLIVFNFFGCSKHEHSSKALVIVSIEPYEYLIKKITENTVEVRSLIPSTANAHSYELSPQKINELIKATIWFQLGEPLEINITPAIQQKNTSLIIYDLTTGLHLINDCCSIHAEDARDLHIWLSPILMKQQASGIASTLIERFPEYAELYKKNLQKVLLELDTLHFSIKDTLNELPQKTLLVTHPAFSYFCKDYDCTQIPIEFEGKDPLPRKLNEVLSLAKEQNAQAIISLPQFSKKSAVIISKSLHIPIYEFNPYDKNYIQNMNYLLELVVRSNEK